MIDRALGDGWSMAGGTAEELMAAGLVHARTPREYVGWLFDWSDRRWIVQPETRSFSEVETHKAIQTLRGCFARRCTVRRVGVDPNTQPAPRHTRYA